KAQKPFGTGTEEVKLKSFAIDFEFHSNKAAVIGEGEGEIKIKKDSTLSIPVGKGACTVVIPEQTIPEKAERKPELEYEAASYTTEFEPAKIKKFPSGFQEKLNIEMEFKKVESWVKPAPGCAPGGVVNEVPETPGFGYVVYGNGTMELELEEITIKNGNVGFEPKKEEI
ncbi:MAG TPA: hypothetical protein VES97_10770, partial [Solirubrobacteraceae bacterium]|nr:hypothetical protein [Solirubrobacteraceae bacterium]